MRSPLLILFLSLVTVTHAGADTSIGPPDLSRCGVQGQYLECHVEPACLYGERKRETPIYLRRYFEEFHGEKDISKCATVLVVRATPPLKKPRSSSYLDTVHVEHDVRSFTASGWIDPSHFSIGVRFVVGQKIVMLSADDGFTDDDDWVYGVGQNGDNGLFPVFNGTFKQATVDGKIRVSLSVQAYNTYRRSHYVVPYQPRQPLSPFYRDLYEKENEQADASEALKSNFLSSKVKLDAAMPANNATTQIPTSGNDTSDVEAQNLQANTNSSSTGAAAPATGGMSIFMIVICIVGAILASFALGLVGYVWVKRKQRKAAANPQTERTQETETLIDPAGENTAVAPTEG